MKTAVKFGSREIRWESRSHIWRLTVLVEINDVVPLLDLIVDHMHDEPTTLFCRLQIVGSADQKIPLRLCLVPLLGKRVGNLGKNGYLNLVKQPRPTHCDADASWDPNAQPTPDCNHCSSLPPRPRPNTKVSITHLSTQTLLSPTQT